jgi:putative ABC transport system permease protein
MKLLRNLTRRKLRTGLTVSGITIGIWALVVFSSMANKINSVVDGGSDFFGGKVVVIDASSAAMGGAPISTSVADEIAGMDGVALAAPRISMVFDPDAGMQMGNAESIVASAPTDEYEELELHYAQGRALTADDADSRATVLGADLARKYGTQAGDDIEIRGQVFEVVGVLEPTLSPSDTQALMPLAAGQDLFAQDLPAVVRDQIGTSELASQVAVYPTDGTDVEALAERIKSELGDVHTMTAASFEEEIGSSVAMFNAIIIGVALISLVVGGLSVVNTMAMSVQERTREIGIKRAIGGSRGRVIRELVSEAALIGLIGGLLGLGLGAAVVVLANEAGRASATVLFDLTVGTSIFALGFSTVLGMAAGLIPAWNAARLDPVQALRHE